MKKHPYTITVVTTLCLVVLDQITKLLAVRHLTTIITPQGPTGIKHEVTLINDFLYFTLHYNEGASWGLFPGRLTFFIIITLLALAVFIYLAKDTDFEHKPLYSLAIPLLIAGATGNFIDRITPFISDMGYVVDMIDVLIFNWDFPIFNVADMALTIGWIALAFDLVFLDHRRVDAL